MIKLISILAFLLVWFVVWPVINTVKWTPIVSQCVHRNEVVDPDTGLRRMVGFSDIWPAGPNGCFDCDIPRWYKPWNKRFSNLVNEPVMK